MHGRSFVFSWCDSSPTNFFHSFQQFQSLSQACWPTVGKIPGYWQQWLISMHPDIHVTIFFPLTTAYSDFFTPSFSLKNIHPWPDVTIDDLFSSIKHKDKNLSGIFNMSSRTALGRNVSREQERTGGARQPLPWASMPAYLDCHFCGSQDAHRSHKTKIPLFW